MQRIEVITGRDRRRNWSDEDKLRIIAEAQARDVTTVEVARRHDLHPNQIYLWKKAFLEGRLQGCRLSKQASHEETMFLPVEVRAEGQVNLSVPSHSPESGGAIEIVLRNGRMVRIGQSFEEQMLKRVVALLEET